MEVEDIDCRYMEGYEFMGEGQRCKMVDEFIPGAYKIEKFIVEGYFLGSKLYATRGFEVD